MMKNILIEENPYWQGMIYPFGVRHKLQQLIAIERTKE